MSSAAVRLAERTGVPLGVWLLGHAALLAASGWLALRGVARRRAASDRARDQLDDALRSVEQLRVVVRRHAATRATTAAAWPDRPRTARAATGRASYDASLTT